MQQPTLRNVRVRTTRDALLIFYAVARRVLPMITRRLDAEERRAISPGNVYIWEERCANSEITGLGMERWTDGISWSASRIAQEFLFYRQRDTDAEPIHTSTQWAKAMKRDPRLGAPSCPRSEADRLIKQTYSVHVSLPEDRSRGITRKWHLTAYFSQATLDSLNTVDIIPGVGDVVVPQGWFRNARASKGKQGSVSVEHFHDDDGPSPLHDPWPVKDAAYRSEFVIDAVAASHDDPSRLLPPAALAPPPPRQIFYQNAGNANGTSATNATSANGNGTYSAYRPPQQAATASPPYTQRLPNLTDSGLDFYRDPSPFTHSSSSSSSELGYSPRPFSTPLTPPTSPPQPQAQPTTTTTTLSSRPSERDLVPLAFLKTLQPPVRDAAAEDCLRRLTGAKISMHSPSHRWPEAVSAQASR